MVRQLAIIAIAAICLAAFSSADDTETKDLAKAQKVLSNLLFNYFEVEPTAGVGSYSADFDLKKQVSTFPPSYQEKVTKFLKHYEEGLMLPRDGLFSPYNTDLIKEVKLIFDVFYHAPDLWLFINIITWAEPRLNRYQFGYVLDVVLLHRKDTAYLPLLPAYQVTPEYFFNTDFMKQVWDYKALVVGTGSPDEKYTHVIPANYSNWYFTDGFSPEHNLAYFREDIYLNAWYHKVNMALPWWLPEKDLIGIPPGYRGDIHFWIKKLVLNRYNMELLSHNIEGVDFPSWRDPMPFDFSPYMTFVNGMHLPQRKAWQQIPIWKNKWVEMIEEFEDRLTAVSDLGYFLNHNAEFENIDTEGGFDKFGNLLLGNNNSLNTEFYGSIDHLARFIMGFGPEPHHPHQILPAALDIPATSMRDPAFYRICKRMLDYFCRYLERLGPYTEKELAFEGVKIESAEIVGQNLTTYFETISPWVEKFSWSADKPMTKIKALQYRLNHEPHTLNMKIFSDKDYTAVVRVFIAQKYNIHGKELSEKNKYFLELDYFLTDLKTGKNTIERNSINTPWFISNSNISEELNTVAETGDTYTFAKQRFGFPSHLIIPRGKPEGMPFEMFFYISEYKKNDKITINAPIFKFYDNKPFGFPLNRPMLKWDMPNMYMADLYIVHNPIIRPLPKL